MYIPNSYEVFWNTDAEKFTQRMLSEYQLFWTNVRTERAEALGMTKNEVMTLASIVYEESKQKKEQPIITNNSKFELSYSACGAFTASGVFRPASPL